MIELSVDDFPRILPLYQSAEMKFPLIAAVIEKKQRGQIFANKRDSPRAALIVTNFGFTLEVGNDQDFDAGLEALFRREGALKPRYLLWYAPNSGWRQRFASSPERVRCRARIRLNFDGTRAAWLNQPVGYPAEYECRRLSPELLPRIEKFSLHIGSRFWASTDDFLTNSFGVCLLKNDEVASVCYAAAVVDGLAEVDVATDERFRGKGLATAATQCFIRECLRRGVLPTWDCFDYNAGSLKLALKLGFVAAYSYPFYSFELPVEFQPSCSRP